MKRPHRGWSWHYPLLLWALCQMCGMDFRREWGSSEWSRGSFPPRRIFYCAYCTRRYRGVKTK